MSTTKETSQDHRGGLITRVRFTAMMNLTLLIMPPRYARKTIGGKAVSKTMHLLIGVLVDRGLLRVTMDLKLIWLLQGVETLSATTTSEGDRDGSLMRLVVSQSQITSVKIFPGRLILASRLPRSFSFGNETTVRGTMITTMFRLK
ncbi:hypothetical protein SERLADRAFT_480388 [Serpula lacrymans var. lacrymans S7.9]|uniref:Uncharacterized protein n=1 Tax=Serpula lacrymans var. lacrymans (strain S7.9) TaxID=578457 RepID=F8PD43_SERL9|nr:uncharacterized protein SERLADRAFT_480388 [Serpula lacrymans var. lacrymans S7.9]EGO19142.1 hypothetical protein SERLADRAFT_480388 [Serpula lacrymans var. lacrymans S7.9]